MQDNVHVNPNFKFVFSLQYHNGYLNTDKFIFKFFKIFTIAMLFFSLLFNIKLITNGQ